MSVKRSRFRPSNTRQMRVIIVMMLCYIISFYPPPPKTEIRFWFSPKISIRQCVSNTIAHSTSYMINIYNYMIPFRFQKQRCNNIAYYVQFLYNVHLYFINSIYPVQHTISIVRLTTNSHIISTPRTPTPDTRDSILLHRLSILAHLVSLILV